MKIRGMVLEQGGGLRARACMHVYVCCIYAIMYLFVHVHIQLSMYICIHIIRLSVAVLAFALKLLQGRFAEAQHGQTASYMGVIGFRFTTYIQAQFR